MRQNLQRNGISGDERGSFGSRNGNRSGGDRSFGQNDRSGDDRNYGSRDTGRQNNFRSDLSVFGDTCGAIFSGGGDRFGGGDARSGGSGFRSRR